MITLLMPPIDDSPFTVLYYDTVGTIEFSFFFSFSNSKSTDRIIIICSRGTVPGIQWNPCCPKWMNEIIIITRIKLDSSRLSLRKHFYVNNFLYRKMYFTLQLAKQRSDKSISVFSLKISLKEKKSIERLQSTFSICRISTVSGI